MTSLASSRLREQKQLAAKEEKVRVFDPVSWTDAQKRLVAHYEPGLQLRFVKATAQFKAGESVEVVGHAGKQLRVQRADGRELPREYRTFSHGYAVTSHAAQGKTVDEVLVVASSQSFPAVSQEQFYVSISRARERARIFTDDAGLLGRRVEDTHTRKAAIELEGLREALAKAGFRRSPVPATPRASVAQSVGRVWRQVRTLRPDRLAPAQRVAEWARVFRQWLGVRRGLGIEQAAQQVTAREQMTLRPEAPRQSRGMRM